MKKEGCWVQGYNGGLCSREWLEFERLIKRQTGTVPWNIWNETESLSLSPPYVDGSRPI